MTLPTISIVTCSYNSDPHIWKKVLESIKMQDYPKTAIEHLVMDGGSTNDTLKLAREYGCTSHVVPELLLYGDSRKCLGIQKSRNEIIVIINTDNILVGRDWFRKMVLPFMCERDVVGTFSMHNTYEPDMPALTRYFALIGNIDVIAYYLGTNEKMTRFQQTYNKGVRIKDTQDYTVVRFSTDTLPTLGCNGHMVRRSVINEINLEPTKFQHTDAFYQLSERGYNTYGVVKNSIIHYAGSNIFQQAQHRAHTKGLSDDQREARSYHVFNSKKTSDVLRLALFIVYSITFIQPLLISIRGFIAVPDRAWFLHPVVCFVNMILHTLSELRYLIRRYCSVKNH